MASTTTPSSLNSFQLQFGHKRFKSSLIFLKIRFPPHIRRIRFISANGAGGESWTANGRSKDSFAGWSGSDADGGGDSKKDKDGFGGMLGAGLAGFFFTAGITFASLSLSSKTTSGGKPPMQPLTTEQEVVLTSDDQTAEVDKIRNEAGIVLSEKQSQTYSSSQTGTNKDFHPHIENNEDSFHSGVDNSLHSEASPIENTKSNDNVVDATHDGSSPDDMHIGPYVDDIPALSASSPSSPELSTSDDVDPSHVSSSTVLSDSLDPAIKHDPNHVDPFPLTNDSTTHINDHQEGNLNNVDMPLDFSSGLELPAPCEDSKPIVIILESGDVVVSEDSTLERVDTATSVSKEEDTKYGDILQLPSDASTLNPTVHDLPSPVTSGTIIGSDLDQNRTLMLRRESTDPKKGCLLNNNAPSVEYSGTVLPDSHGNEPDMISHSQIGKSSTFESTLPEKPFSYAGIPAPSLVSAALQVPPGRVLVPAVVDQVQGQALAALQVLKVVEADAQPGDLCTRREYARWLVSASSVLSRNTFSKVYPAMYIENLTELAFDDITPEDLDYPCIQGLAEAGIISSKLSDSDLNGTSSGHMRSFFFSPDSPVSRQDLVSWKMALEKRQLPEVDRNSLYKCSGYIDIDRIDKDAWPALVADLSAGEQGITALAFGYTRLFQPNKPVTKAQAAIALSTGEAAEVVGEELTRIEAESLAESAVNAHTALVAQVEKELNASFELELAKEREKTHSLEKLADEARLELEKLKAEGEERHNALIRERAAVESEMEVLSRLRHEVEEQLHELMSNKIEISFEKDKISKLRKEAESENQIIVQLQYELEVERKALSMARAWAEEEAKRAREHARALEQARDRWVRHGIKVIVDEDLQEDALTGVTWLTAGQQQQEEPQIDQTVDSASNLLEKLKAMAAEIKVKSSAAIERIIQKIQSLISYLKDQSSKTSKRVGEIKTSMVSKAGTSMEELKENVSGFSSSISEKARRAVEECKGSVEKFTQKFKTT